MLIRKKAAEINVIRVVLTIYRECLLRGGHVYASVLVVFFFSFLFSFVIDKKVRYTIFQPIVYEKLSTVQIGG